MSKPSKEVLRLPIEKPAEIAFKVAVAKAIDEHTRLGLPFYVWRNSRVAKLSPEQNTFFETAKVESPIPCPVSFCLQLLCSKQS